MTDLKQLRVQYLTNENGEKISVVLPVQQFNELLEDIDDLAAVAERRLEPTISHNQLIEELKRDGFLSD